MIPSYIIKQRRIVLAFVPVDSEHTILYLSSCLDVSWLPVLSHILSLITQKYSRKIAHQDRRVACTHEPRSSGLHIGESLFHADGLIIEYRRRRQELLESNLSEGLK